MSLRILFLTHAFNGLSQRLYIELSRLGHEVSIEFDVNDEVTREAVELFRPELLAYGQESGLAQDSVDVHRARHLGNAANKGAGGFC